MADVLQKLNTGASIPALGLGTWQSAPGEVARAVSYAVKAGYRHIDCAWVYRNEKEVGQGLAEAMKSGVRRSDLFITTKLWCTYHTRAEENLDKSLENLGLDYVDLYLMHWPVPMNKDGNDERFPKLPDGSRDLDHHWSYLQTWKEMEKLMKTGKVRAIGVANHSKRFLEQLLSQAEIVPAANQIENHPLLPQQDIVDLCMEKGIHVTAYSPLGSTGSPLFENEHVIRLANKKGVTPGCVLISYQIARGNSVIPKSVTPSRIEENLKTVALDATDLEELAAISKNGVNRYIYPPFGVNLGFPDKQEISTTK